MLFSRHEKALGHFNSKASFPSRDSSEDKYMDIQGNTFAFGVILLEIISGRLPYCKDKGYLVDWVSRIVSQPHCNNSACLTQRSRKSKMKCWKILSFHQLKKSFAAKVQITAHSEFLILYISAGHQVPPAAGGDREAGRPGADQRADGGPGGDLQRGEPVRRPRPVQAAVDADHRGGPGDRHRPLGGRHPQGVLPGVGGARPVVVAAHASPHLVTL
uniref:Serine-threonine/tyrosine-protein kinase catalytic domain-containing protein n=1 Tax=Aegilops tauschii subsp. strangulata TaxID=200361 RepID=A0A453DIB8_AEGTS